MAFAAASQKHHHHLKHHQNLAFSPPSQVMSNYASFGPATNNPFWHTGFLKNNGNFHMTHDNRDYHHHFHKLPEYQSQHQIQPNIHPSVITPFLEQVHQKQKEAAAAEQKNAYKQSQEANSQENNGSFEVINDVFSKHLVPPPPSNPTLTNFKSNPSGKPEKQEKINKYNLSMPSPLQDASRFNYNNVISTATPATPKETLRFNPSAADNNYSTTEKPNVFVNLNRTKDNVYKHHKLLHPSYTGGLKRKPSIVVNDEKPFLPTPYKPEKDEEQYKNIKVEPHHSFFTIEDAVTGVYQGVKSHIPVNEEPEVVAYNSQKKTKSSKATTVQTTSTTFAPLEQTSPKPRQKLRRRKRPLQQKQQLSSYEAYTEATTSVKPNRVRGSLKNIDTQTEQNDLKTRNKVNHPSRTRNRLNLSSAAATISTIDYDSTVKSSTEEEKREELTSAFQVSTEASTTSVKSEESSEQPENVKRRVRLRYKNKLRTNSLETADFRSKVGDNQISDTENEQIVVKHNDVTTEPNIATENGANNIRSSLKLPNLKLRNDLTTLPTTADTISTSVQPPSSSTTTIEQEENNVLGKIINRPRFSIKEYKRKQLSTASTPLTSSTTVATTTKPDSLRFNRLRVSLNRRRNETIELEEESDFPRKRSSTQRSTSTTTESTPLTSSKRGTLPKRTFATRNFTKPVVNLNDIENSTSSKTAIKSSTSFGSNRPTSPSLRSRIQSYKHKEVASEVAEMTPEPNKNNISFGSEATVEPPVTTLTESPYKHETSIMKIAKTPSSVQVTKSNDFLDDTSENSRSDFDLTGSPSDYSQRVAELTISGNENYSFKSANIGPLSRRIPNYFTISTDDPILPIQAFFPQIKTSENVSLPN